MHICETASGEESMEARHLSAGSIDASRTLESASKMIPGIRGVTEFCKLQEVTSRYRLNDQHVLALMGPLASYFLGLVGVVELSKVARPHPRSPSSSSLAVIALARRDAVVTPRRRIL